MNASVPTLPLETAPTATEQPNRNDNSNPQQGTGGARSTPKSPEGASHPQSNSGGYSRPSLIVPPTKKDERKLFVGGLPSDVTNEEFHSFFEQFGPVLDSIVLVDRNTNRSRGFGFVTFESPETSRKVLSCGSTDGSNTHPQTARLEMRGKLIEVKLAVPKESTRRVPRPHRPNHAAYAMPGVAPYPYPMYGDQSKNGFQYPPVNEGYVPPPPPYYPAPGAVFAGYMAPMYTYYRPDMAESSYSVEGSSPSAYAFFPSPPPFGYGPQPQGQVIPPQQHFFATPPLPQDSMEGESH